MAPLKLLVFAAMARTAYGVGKAGGEFDKKNFADDFSLMTSADDFFSSGSIISRCEDQLVEIKKWKKGPGGNCPNAAANTNTEEAFGKDLKRSVVEAKNGLDIAKTKFENKKELLKTEEKKEEFDKKLLKNLKSNFENKKYEEKRANSGKSSKGTCRVDAKGKDLATIFELPDGYILLKDCEKMFKLATSAHKSVYKDSYDSSCWTMIIISAVVVFAVLIAVIMMFCKSSNADE